MADKQTAIIIMRTDLIIIGIFGIIVINLIIFFIARGRTVDRGLKNYLKNTYKE